MAPRVWRAGPEEAEAVAGLLVEFRDFYGRDWPSANAFLAGVERLIEEPGTEYLLAATAPERPPAGVAQLRFRHGLWLAAEDCLLEDLFVREDERRSGLGRVLLDAAVARATERGCRRVELDVLEDNAAAVALYEAAGFASGSGTPGHRGLFMRLRLVQNMPEGVR